jgi:hypothetical protein
MEGGGAILHTKIGGVPLVAIVGVAAGLVALWLAVRSRSRAPSGPGGTAIDPLAPSAAEAFGTLQQQQSDLSNALSALGMGQQDILTGQTAIAGGVNDTLQNQWWQSLHDINPSLFDPAYQQELIKARGWIFSPESGTSTTPPYQFGSLNLLSQPAGAVAA